MLAWGGCMLAVCSSQAPACPFDEIGSGRVSEVIDGRSFRLADGREIRLAAIETELGAGPPALRRDALAELVGGREVVLRAADDGPDRYGRQHAFAYLAGSGSPLQAALLAKGMAVISDDVGNRSCEALLAGAESEARQARRGLWGDPGVIKNAETSDTIIPEIGRFAVIEGRILSVRQTGILTYLNFGRRWTTDFAATIPKRALAGFEAAGVSVKSLENRRIRVRGWVEGTTAPRIEILRVSQIEVLDGK